MQNKPKAIVLGGTNPHKELINNLNKRGYYTILIDYYENPPAKNIADEHIRESTLDMEKVLQIAKETGAKLVISACVDQANITACYVAEKLGLPAPYSYETALSVTDKGLMKKKMAENMIPTSKYIFIDDKTVPEKLDLGFPVVVKPADSNGSKGVKKARNFAELKDYLEEAIKISRAGTAIIEEYKEGKDIDAVCFVQNRKAHLIMLRQRFQIKDDKKMVMQHFHTLVPAEISLTAKNTLTHIANQIAAAFNLENTSLLIQTVVNGDSIDVIEFAPRVGGGMSFRTVKLSTGFDILNATVDSYLGEQTKIVYSEPKAYFSEINIHTLPCIFGRIAGYEELIENKIIEEFYSLKIMGSEIDADLASRNRVGSFIVKASSKKELAEKMKLAIETLEVFDINGKSVIRKDIYFNASF